MNDFSYYAKYPLMVLTIATLLSSCASLYIPNSVNTPLLTSKNEATISANTGMNGWDFQAAYSPLNHLGIMLNASGAPILSKSNSYHGHKYIEGGLGFNTSFGNSGVFEIYTGGGYGTSQSKSNITVNGDTKTDKVEGVGARYFIQPSIGAKRNGFEHAFSLRGVYTEFHDVRYDNYTTLHTRFGTYIEPAYTIRFGGRNLLFQSQVGASLPLSTETTEIKYRPFMMNLGIIWRIGSYD